MKGNPHGEVAIYMMQLDSVPPAEHLVPRRKQAPEHELTRSSTWTRTPYASVSAWPRSNERVFAPRPVMDSATRFQCGRPCDS